MFSCVVPCHPSTYPQPSTNQRQARGLCAFSNISTIFLSPLHSSLALLSKQLSSQIQTTDYFGTYPRDCPAQFTSYSLEFLLHLKPHVLWVMNNYSLRPKKSICLENFRQDSENEKCPPYPY